MKRFAVVLLIFVLCFVSLFVGAVATAFAADASDLKIELSDTFTGEELTVVARVTENRGFISGVFRVDYDTAGLELQAVTHSSTYEALSPFDNFENVRAGKATSLLVFYAGEGAYTTQTGDAFTLTFRVKDGAVNGKHKVSLYITELFKTSDPTEKFNGQDETLADAHTGGVLAAETEYFVSNGVPTPVDPETDHTLLIVLVSVGFVLVLAGIGVAAYILYRRNNNKRKQ